MEKIDVSIFDVTGAYLKTALPAEKFLMMLIRDEFVDVMFAVNPEYIPYVSYENGKKVLCVNILRDI